MKVHILDLSDLRQRFATTIVLIATEQFRDLFLQLNMTGIKQQPLIKRCRLFNFPRIGGKFKAFWHPNFNSHERAPHTN